MKSHALSFGTMIGRKSISVVAVCLCLIGLAGLASSTVAFQTPAKSNPDAERFFESKIRPLFHDQCVSCHNHGKAQGGLKLDAPVTAEQAKEIIVRMKGEGGKPRMPLGGQVATDKINLVEQWAASGAVWPATAIAKTGPSLMERGKTHWAFLPIKSPSPPSVKRKSWVANPIDAFVLRKLEAKGLSPNPSASRQQLIRRLTYNLTGLPPTPEEVAEFESDKSPNAYEKLVDRLLDSPHYGEKWARHWLDLVRFAETNSYERDNPKPYAFKYRDYVIRSFNSDKPYDQFVREQLAGDEMTDSPGDAILATTYYRLGIWDDEPADKLQAKYDDLDDIILTTGHALLGLTLDCARCHDHKLDPISQKDYYRLLAVFHNINRYKNGGATDESMYYPDMEAKRRHESTMSQLATSRKSALEIISSAQAALAAKGANVFNPNDLTDMNYRYFERDWKRIPDFENEPVIASGSLKPGLISITPRQRNEEWSLEFNGKINVAKDGEYTFRFSSQGGYRFTVAGERLFDSFASQDEKPITKTAKKQLKAGKHDLTLIYNQRQKQHGLAISWSGPDFEYRPLSTLDSCGEGQIDTLLGPKWRDRFEPSMADRLVGTINEQAKLEMQAPATEKVLCVTEAGTSVPETHILLRGVPTAKGDKVEPGFPTCVGGGGSVKATPPSTNKSTGLRTELANWIVSPKHPLTARVIVNRVWQHHFGRGIVRTPNDFGLQGSKPTHPELLDWLSSTFIKDGWSLKKLHKRILMSNTFKQSVASNVKSAKADPSNDLFWHFDSRRLTAEEIRDSILSVSGNLNMAMFGPSVYPEIPKEILAAQSRPGKDWFTERMSESDVCRRSIYVNVKRSLIYPLFASFDLPETDRPSPARFASTQPTQALGALNGKLFHQQADLLAKRAVKEVGESDEKVVKRVLGLALQRTASSSEVNEGKRLLTNLRSRGVSTELARKYLGLMALNLNEFMYLD